MISGRGTLREEITKETPMSFELIKTYECDVLRYVLLSTEDQIFLVRKPYVGERLRDFKKSTLIILPNYDFYIVLYRVKELIEGENIVKHLIEAANERRLEMNG